MYAYCFSRWCYHRFHCSEVVWYFRTVMVTTCRGCNPLVRTNRNIHRGSNSVPSSSLSHGSTFWQYLQTSYTPLAFGPPIYGCGAIWNDRPSLFAWVACPSIVSLLPYMHARYLDVRGPLSPTLPHETNGYLTVDTTASALVLASDSFLLIVTWVKTVGIRKNSMRLGLHTPLMTLLLRDGTLYFA